jgi:alkylation response protein AidB-like acyl-CoA dehydrogenase
MPAQAWDGDQPAWTEDLLEARSATIYGGTSEIQRDIIGDRILDLAQEDPLRDVPWKQIPR